MFTRATCGLMRGADAVSITVLCPVGAFFVKITRLTCIAPLGPGVKVGPGEKTQLAPAVIAGPLHDKVIVGLQFPSAETIIAAGAVRLPCSTLIGLGTDGLTLISISTTRIVAAIVWFSPLPSEA